MSRELTTSWGDYTLALDRLLALPMPRQLLIYDEDLQALHLEERSRLEKLGKALVDGGEIRIALRDGSALQRRNPRLLSAMAPWAHRVQIRSVASDLIHLRDSLIIADERLALVRFDKEQARAVLLDAAEADFAAYTRRFDEIWQNCREDLLHHPLGL